MKNGTAWKFVEEMSDKREYFDVTMIPSIEKKKWNKLSYLFFNILSYGHYMSLLQYRNKFL